jgi:hypothetical protein
VIRSEEAPFVSVAEGTRALAIILALHKSAELNQPVIP